MTNEIKFLKENLDRLEIRRNLAGDTPEIKVHGEEALASAYITDDKVEEAKRVIGWRVVVHEEVRLKQSPEYVFVTFYVKKCLTVSDLYVGQEFTFIDDKEQDVFVISRCHIGTSKVIVRRKDCYIFEITGHLRQEVIPQAIDPVKQLSEGGF